VYVVRAMTVNATEVTWQQLCEIDYMKATRMGTRNALQTTNLHRCNIQQPKGREVS